MPELPEVEVRRRIIDNAFKGKTLASFDIYKKGIVKYPDAHVLNRLPDNSFFFPSLDGRDKREGGIGKVLRHTDRRGKYMVLEFADGLSFTLHFGLFGEMTIGNQDDNPPSICARLVFDNKKALFLLKWASIWIGKGIKELEKLGPDPIAEPESFTPEYLANALSKKRKNIKQFLMDQAIIAGIGAVYADEILFRSGILPTRLAGTVSRQEAAVLYKMILRVLDDAIEKTVASGKEDRPFLSLDGKQNCPVCKTPIIKTRLAGRRTVYCPACQH